MGKKLLSFIFVLFALSSWLPAGISAQTILNMPQFGKQEVTVTDEITFYDTKGTDKIQSSSSNNAYSCVVFKPSEAGKVVQIDFESVDVRTDMASYPASLKIYNGIYDKDNTVVYPTSTSGVTSTGFPVNDQLLANLDGMYDNLSYISADASGAISVCFHYRYAKTCDGWVAKVRTITVSDMEVESAGALYDKVPSSVYAGKKGVPFAGFYVNAEGILNPHKVTSVTFSITPAGQGVIVPENLKLYAGDRDNYSGATPVSAIIAGSDGLYTFTLDKPLSSGENIFYIAGDISGSAAFDSNLKVQIEKVSTSVSPDGLAGFIPAEAKEVTVARVIMMPSAATTFTIDDNPVSFYDDGGPEGNISENFKGQATFKPGVDGKKVMIDFKSLTLFESSNKNEIVKVYNGSQAIESNLIMQLKSGTPVVIRSTSEDGALTVMMNCDTGYPKAGFEASVSLFTPVAMTVSSTDVMQYTTGPVAAGETAQPILYFNIKAENTEPALLTDKFQFTTNESFNKVSKGTVYYTGRSNTFSTDNKIGEALVSGDSFTVSTGTPVKLQEGDNYFWLAYDIVDNAIAGETVDASLVKYTLSDGAHEVTAGDPDGNRTVKNEYISKIGTAEKTVYGTWTYTHTKQSNGNYEVVNGDQIVTFMPGTPGMIMEMEYSDFEVAYATSSYGVKAKYKIYSGKGTGGELLWEANASNSKKGPDGIIRSKSADGAITVVFNANDSYSYNGAKGWHAEVREYLSVPMFVDEVKAFQSSTSVIPVTPTSLNQHIIGFKMTMKGDLNPPELTEVTLDLKGCSSNVAKAYLYTSGKDSIAVNEMPLAEAVPSAGSEELVLPLSAAYALKEGSYYYWITFDMKDAAEAEKAIDAALKSVKAGGNTVVSVIGDPDGERTTKNIFCLKSGDNGTVKIGNAPLAFFDEGGADSGITRNFKGWVTFEPETPGRVIKLNIKSIDMGSDKIYITYSDVPGNKNNKDVEISNPVKITEVKSLSDDGKMTFYFETASYGSTNLKGFEMEVSQYEIKPLTLGKVEVVPVSDPGLLRDSENNKMLRLDVQVDGDKGSFSIDKICFNSAGTSMGDEISKACIYATDTISVCLTDKRYGEAAQGSPFVFTENYTVTKPGTYKFWLTYDISGVAISGSMVNANPVSVTVQGDKVVELADSPSAMGYIVSGFKGSYTIGKSAGADYASFADAIKAISNGIDGPVVFNVEKGEYKENIRIPAIKGASSRNTITFRSQSGDYNDVLINNNIYSKPGTGNYDDYYGLITVDGTDYLTFEGISATSTNTSYEALFYYRWGTNHLTLRNCRFYAARIDGYTGMPLVKSTYRQRADEPNNYATIEGCVFSGARNNIEAGGYYVSVPNEKGLMIRNNKFSDFGTRAIYIPGEEQLVITGNEITNGKSANTIYGLDLRQCFGECIVGNNIISLKPGTVTAYGISLQYAHSDASAPSYIYNNEVNIVTGSTSTSYGIYLSDASDNLHITYNTVRMSGSETSSAALYFYAAMTNMSATNNVLQSEKGYVYRFYNANYITGVALSNNALFTGGTTFAYAGGGIGNFDAWKELSKESGSYNEKVVFLSDAVLQPKEAGNLINAVASGFVKNDINGTVRPQDKPTIGAYEYDPNAAAAPTMAEGYAVVEAIAYNEATAVVKSSLPGRAFAVVKETGAAAPSVEEVIASPNNTDLRQMRPASVKVNGLEQQTKYRLYVVLQNLFGVNSGVIAGPQFETTYTPTAVSDFESVKSTETGFEDGTASFVGFTVTSETEAPVKGSKVAEVTAVKAIVTPINSQKGIPLSGFYLKSDGGVSMSVYDQDGESKDYSVVSTDMKWSFVNLKDKGMITKVELSAASKAYIDDFSGTPRSLLVYVANVTVNEGETVNLDATVKPVYGVAPYTYVWKNGKGETVSEKPLYSFSAGCLDKYSVTVTDAWGEKADDAVLVTVRGTAHVATFEDKGIAPETYWNGEKPESMDTGKFSYWYSGSYEFTVVKHTDTWWSGFAYSNETSTSFDGSLTQQYRSSAGSGHNSATYAVVYPGSPNAISTTTAEDGGYISGFYTTNSAYAKSVMLEGDGSYVKEPFAKGDYFKAVITGTDKSGGKKTVEYYLADYRPDNEADRYCLDTWQWVDLRSLGKVTKVTFNFEGSRNNDMGLVLPAYACIDDFGGVREIEQKDEETVGLGETSIELSQFFALEDADASVAYKIEDDFDNSGIGAEISGSSLDVDGKVDGAEASLVVSATQKGKIQFAEIPVRVDRLNGVDVAEQQPVTIFPVPATDRLNIFTGMTGYRIEVMTLGGTSVMSIDGNMSNTSIDVTSLSSGVYILKLTSGSETVVKRFTVK